MKKVYNLDDGSYVGLLKYSPYKKYEAFCAKTGEKIEITVDRGSSQSIPFNVFKLLMRGEISFKYIVERKEKSV